MQNTITIFFITIFLSHTPKSALADTESDLAERMLISAQRSLVETGRRTFPVDWDGYPAGEVTVIRTFESRYKQTHHLLVIAIQDYASGEMAPYYGGKKQYWIRQHHIAAQIDNPDAIDPLNYDFLGYIIDGPHAWKTVDLRAASEEYALAMVTLLQSKGRAFGMNLETLLSLPQEIRDNIPGVTSFRLIVKDGSLSEVWIGSSLIFKSDRLK